MSKTSVPLADLGWQHAQIADEVSAGFAKVLNRTSFVLGPDVREFERAYAEYSGVAHCVGVANGTDAVELALRACGIGAGDEVIIPANTFIATAEAVVRAGAAPVLADCGEDFLLDPDPAAEAVSARTRAVVPVHLYGQMAPMKAVSAMMPSDIVIIEDAAQSQGATQAGARSGSVGDAAATSFYPGKNLGAYGDAGAVTTQRDDVAGRLRLLRNHGGVHKYEHVEVGVNSRLDELQAVVLSAKLRRLDDWNQLRSAAADRYSELLADLPDVVTPVVVDGNTHVWHLYVVRVPRRDRVLQHLNENGIGAGLHYPAPVHLLPAFSDLGQGPGSFPVAERLATEILTLPLYPNITADQQQFVVDTLADVLRTA